MFASESNVCFYFKILWGFFEVHEMIHVRESQDPLTSARKFQEYRYKVIQFWIRKVVMTIEQEDKRDILKKNEQTLVNG